MQDTGSADAGELRDSYGFEVNKKYAEFYKKFAPVWEQEETERVQNWLEFFESYKELLGEAGSSADVSDVSVQESILEKFFSLEKGTSQAANTKVLHGLVNAGLPFQLRGKAWKVFLGLKARKVNKLYEQLVEQSLGPLKTKKYLDMEDIKGRCASLLSQQKQDTSDAASRSNDNDNTEQDFPDLGSPRSPGSKLNVKAWVPSGKDFLGQIEKDLHRTFPGNQLMDKTGRCALRRILAAYSVYNPKVGYCQGMNFLAGCFLLFMDEEDAFWCLTVMAEEVVPGYFSMAMVAPQVDQRVFKQLVEHELPSLHHHLEALGADVSCVFAQWFLCSYVNSLPLETCLRVWDVMFLEKNSLVLFKVGLAIVAIYSSALLSLNDLLEVCDLLQSIAPMTYDASKLLEVALYGYEHLNAADLNTLREINRKTVLADLERSQQVLWKSPESLKNRLQRELNKPPPVVVIDDPAGGSPVSDEAAAAAGESSSGDDVQTAVASHQVLLDTGSAGQDGENGDRQAREGETEEEPWHKTPRWESMTQFNNIAQESMMHLAAGLKAPRRIISYTTGDIQAFNAASSVSTATAATATPDDAKSEKLSEPQSVAAFPTVPTNGDLTSPAEDEPGRRRSVAALGEALGVSAIFEHYQAITDKYRAPRASVDGEARSAAGSSKPSTAAAISSEAAAASDEGTAGKAVDPALLEQLVTAVQQLESELWTVEKKRVDAEAVVQHYNSIIHLLRDKIDYLLSLLTEKDKLILVLTDKLNKVLSELADQDTDIAEKDDQIQELQKTLRLLELKGTTTVNTGRMSSDLGGPSHPSPGSPSLGEPRSKLSSFFKVLRLRNDEPADQASTT